jgi:predicted nucleotidyltransferase
MDIEEIKKRIIPILNKHAIRKAGIFGSYARQQESQESDIDIVVELGKKISLLDLAGIKLELEDALNMKVDLLEYEAVKPSLQAIIDKEQIPVL